MTTTTRIALAFALAIAGFTGAAVAAEGADWQAAYDKFSKTADQVGPQLDAKHMELATQLNSPSPDKNRIQELYKEIGELQGQLAAARVDLQGPAGAGYAPHGGYGMRHGGGMRMGMGGGMGGGYGHRGGGSMGHGGGHHGGW